MKKLKQLLLTVGLAAAVMIPTDLFASHTAGMGMHYRHISGTTYEFTVVFYRNCNGISAPTTFRLGAKSASLNVNNTNAQVLQRLPISGPGIPPLQPPNLYNCTTAPLCYEEYVYRGQLNLNNISPGNTSAKDWIFFVSLCCRPGGAGAADNIQGGVQYIECGLNNEDFGDGNNSAFWHNLRPNFPGFLNDTTNNPFMRTMCTDNFYTFDQSVKDYDGDDIIYEFINPLDAGGVPETYINGYSLANPFPFYTPPGFSINANGIIEVTPSPPANPAHDIYVIAIKATELKTDTIFTPVGAIPVVGEGGFVMRDMTLFIDGPSTCRFDSLGMAPRPIACGDSIIVLRFEDAAGVGSRVRCETISPDGSEFRVIDNRPSLTRPRSIAVLESNWVCGSGNNTNEIRISLAEPLEWDGVYDLMLKTGNDLDVIESECGFLEAEFNTKRLVLTGGTPVDLGLPPAISICIPTVDPFPNLVGTSAEAVRYDWKFNGDTVADHDINNLWAQEPGLYEVLVRGPYGCPGSDSVRIFFPEFEEVKFELPPYCDTTFSPDADNLPAILVAPDEPSAGDWSWEFDFGPPNGFGLVSSDDTLVPIGEGVYQLVYTAPPVFPGVAGCVTTFEFEFDRTNHPPEAPLSVQILGDPTICEQGGEEATLWVDSAQIKNNFRARPGYPTNLPYEFQWFQGNLDTPIDGAIDNSIIRDDEDVYYVVVRDQYGCTDWDSTIVKRIGKQPAFEVFCEVLVGKAGQFRWDPVPSATGYEVSFDGGLTWEPNQETFIRVDDIRVTGSVKVKAIMPNACKESDISDSYPCAADVFPPNIFSPNNDGLNDFFFIGSLDLFPGSEVKIFDRWGTITYESDNYQNDWDGGDAPEGTYYYIINVNDPVQSVYKGVITLVR